MRLSPPRRLLGDSRSANAMFESLGWTRRIALFANIRNRAAHLSQTASPGRNPLPRVRFRSTADCCGCRSRINRVQGATVNGKFFKEGEPRGDGRLLDGYYGIGIFLCQSRLSTKLNGD